jgi:hypothetical protein
MEYDKAVIANQKSPFPETDVANVTPEINLLVNQTQLDKLTSHILDIYLPFAVKQRASDPNNKRGLDQKEADKVAAFIKAGDWADAPPHTPIKVVPKKSEALVPDAVAMIKIKGMRGRDMIQEAIVRSDADLKIPGSVDKFPSLEPIANTVFTLYPGCEALATLNLYAYVASKVPGVSASATTVVFRADAEQFGGGLDVDMDEIFIDDLDD